MLGLSALGAYILECKNLLVAWKSSPTRRSFLKRVRENQGKAKEFRVAFKRKHSEKWRKKIVHLQKAYSDSDSRKIHDLVGSIVSIRYRYRVELKDKKAGCYREPDHS